MDVTLSNKYLIEKKIGEGTFGKIFQARNRITGEKVAVKINYGENNNNVVLKNEARIYTILSDIKGVPRMRNFGMDGSYNFMVLDILGSSLLDLKEQYGKEETLSLKTVLSVGLQMLRRIESIHDKGFLHRDIKPDNFLFGSERHSHVLYIIDFGLAKKYCKYTDHNKATSKNSSDNSKYHSQDIGHISCESGRAITGTERYVSLNIHNGLTPSRRDDIESIGYVMIYLLMGRLPWSKTEDDMPNVCNMKKHISHWMLEKNMPTEFITYIQYCRNMEFDERPDYNYLRMLFVNLFKQKRFAIDNYFEWNPQPNAPNIISPKQA